MTKCVSRQKGALLYHTGPDIMTGKLQNRRRRAVGEGEEEVDEADVFDDQGDDNEGRNRVSHFVFLFCTRMLHYRLLYLLSHLVLTVCVRKKSGFAGTCLDSFFVR